MKSFAIDRKSVVIVKDGNRVSLPPALFFAVEQDGVFLLGANEYWAEDEGGEIIHQIGTVQLPVEQGDSSFGAGTVLPPGVPQWIDLTQLDSLGSGVANFIPPSRAPYCNRIEEFQALVSAIEVSAGVVPPAEKRRRLSQAVQGSEVFRRAYRAAKVSSAVNAALTMVAQFVTGAADIADEILFMYFADLVKELHKMGSPFALNEVDLSALLQDFESAGYDTDRLAVVIEDALASS